MSTLVGNVGVLEDPSDDEACGSCGSEKNVTYGPDPYDEDVNGDDTPVWLCATCRHEHAMDI